MIDRKHCEFVDIPGYEGLYQVSRAGIVKSLRSGKWGTGVAFLRWTYDDAGYPRVMLYRAGRGVKKRVHSLVALVFLGERPEGMEVRHLDGNPGDPRLSNLAYGTSVENEDDKRVHGTLRTGSSVWGAKLTEEDIPNIRQRIMRGDRVCDIARDLRVFAQRITDIKHGRTWRHI